jgi:starvation-inducible DNA-binding protein
VCESLQQTLVELAALASHTKQAHWNISGPNFMSVHLYLDQLTDVLRQRFDDVGERIAALGGSPDARPITVSESTTLSSIPAGPLDVGSALGAIEANLTSLTETIGARLAANADTVSVDLYTPVLDDLAQHRWFVDAQL